MRYIKLSTIFFIFFIVFIVLALTLLIICPINTHIEEVNCFDKYSNKINGVVCEEEVEDYEFIHYLAITFAILSAGLVSIGIVRKFQENF